MWTKADYRAFQNGLNAILGDAKNATDDELVEKVVNYLDEEMRKCAGPLERDYAAESFRRQITDSGRETLGNYVMEWAEECASDIRWPVAYTYIVTGKLANDYRENTTATVVVEDREGKVLGHRVIHWSDYAHIEDDEKWYGAFEMALYECALELGARSIFQFYCNGRLNRSVSVYYTPEPGASLFHERVYRDANDDDATGPSAATEEQVPDVDFGVGDEEFMKGLDDL
jgi:hypothetical protein